MKNKKVTVVSIVEELWKIAILGCVTSHSPNLICISRITSFLLSILSFFAYLLILLLKIVDFGKLCTVCNGIRDFIGF